MDRSRARTWMIRSQAAVGVLLVAGAAIALSPIPFGGAAPALTARPTGSSRPAEVRASEPIDVALSERLVAVALPQPSEQRPPEPRPSDVSPVPEAAAPRVVLEYLGAMIGPAARRAIVVLTGEPSVTGDQRMVREGQTIEGIRINAITSDYLMVEEKGEQRRIDRKGRRERVASATTMGAASGKALAAQGPQGSKSIPQGPSKGSGVGKEAMQAELRARQREQFLEAMRASDYGMPESDMLEKFGIGGFQPTADELEAILRQIKGELNGDPSGGTGLQQRKE